jgi:predicted amidohydrolase
MFSTGFATEPEGVAERDGSSLQWMKAMAGQLDAAVAGSVAVEVEGTYHNRLYFVKPDGNVTAYDKRHLFRFGGEADMFSQGENRVVVEHKGYRILLQVCYDLRFPVWSRNRNDYDVIFYVANWPDSRRKVFDTLLKARAIENQSYVIGVNRVGDDGNGLHYDGGSCIIDFKGEYVGRCPDNEEFVLTEKLDIEALRQFREKFPAWSDADEFSV